jgi:uncharacterized protein YkwD
MADITCPKCQRRFTTESEAAAPSACPRCRRALEAPMRWYVGRARKKHGPFTWLQLQALAQRGRLRPEDLLRPASGGRWSTVATFPALMSALPAVRPRRKRLILLGSLGSALLLLAGLGLWAWRPSAVEEATAPPAPLAVAVEPPPPALPAEWKEPVPPKATPPTDLPAPAPSAAPPTAEEEAKRFVERLNAQRVLAGVGALAQDMELSRACTAHARYLAQHQSDLTPDTMRTEEPARRGFSEEGRHAAEAAILAFDEPHAALLLLMARMNSRVRLLNPELQGIGLGFARAADGGPICVIDALRGRGEPVVFFPAPGQKDVPLTFSGGPEIPASAATAGFPVTVTFPEITKVAQAQAHLEDDAGQPVDAWLSTPDKSVRPRNTVALIAKAPLQRMRTYRVRVTAQVDGRPWTKDWQFTTEDDSDSNGTWARKALERVNAYRDRAGLTPVLLDAELGRGCLAHARYLALNAGHPATLGLGAHNEDAALPGFSEEGRKAGKASDIAIGDFEPLDGLDGWMATLYHRVPILNPRLKTIGFGCARGRRLGWISVLNVGTGRVRGAESQPVFYPVAEQRDVPLHFPAGGEEPNPIPNDGDGKAGFPITATFPENMPLKNAQGTLRDEKGKLVPCWFSTPAQPANPHFAGHQGGTVCLIPHDPLLSSTQYRVELRGELAGKAWEKQWRFTTAAGGLDAVQAAAQVVERLNDMRRLAGVRTLTADEVLSAGCQAHAEYLVRNAEALAKDKRSVNEEDATLPGFTPMGLRASRQSLVFSDAPTPVAQIDDLLATSLSRVFLLDPNLRRIGFGCALDVGRGWRCVLDLNGGRGDPRVVLYPGPRQEAVPCAGADRVPTAPDQVAGFPITVTATMPVRKVQALLKDAAGQEVDIVLSTPEAPLTPAAPRHTIDILARRPLQPNETYMVTVSAIVGAGTEWRQTWQFTTAAPEIVPRARVR